MMATRFVSLTLALALSGCGIEQDAEEVRTVAKPSLTVTTATVQRHSLARAIEAQGQIAPWQEAIISAKINGVTLTELQADIGDKVKKGQLLAKFDSRLVQAELAEANASLAQASANAK